MSFRSNIFGQRSTPIGTEPNTFIGNVADVIQTPANLASILGILETDIANFNISGADIEARITTSYAIPGSSFRNNANQVTYFRDTDNLVYFIDNAAFYQCFDFYEIEARGLIDLSINCFGYTKVKYLIFPLLNGLPIYASGFFSNLSYIHGIYAPLLSPFKNIGNDNLFTSTNLGFHIWTHPANQTINNGAEEGDLAYARNNRGATIHYEDYDFDAPIPPITDLQAVEIYGTAVSLTFTSTSPDFYSYKVLSNGAFNSEYLDKSKITAINLEENSNHAIQVIAVDALGKECASNVLNVDTITAYAIPENLQGYFKLEEPSGSLIDSHGSLSGSIVGSVNRAVAGRKNLAIEVVSTGYPRLSVTNMKSFCFWIFAESIPTGAYLMDVRTTNAAYIEYPTSVLACKMEVNNTPDSIPSDIPLNEWVFVYVELNATLASGYLHLLARLNNVAHFPAIIDEVAIFSQPMTHIQKSEYKNKGKGVTINS